MNLKAFNFERIRNIFTTDIDEQFIGLANFFLFFLFFLFIQFIVFWLNFLFPEKNEISLAQKDAFKKIELKYPNEVELVKEVNPVRKDVYVVLRANNKDIRRYMCNEILIKQEHIKLCRIGLDQNAKIKSIVFYTTNDFRKNYVNLIKYETDGVTKELSITNLNLNKKFIETKAKNKIILIAFLNSFFLLLILIVLKFVRYNSELNGTTHFFNVIFSGLKIVLQIIVVINFIAIWVFVIRTFN